MKMKRYRVSKQHGAIFRSWTVVDTQGKLAPKWVCSTGDYKGSRAAAIKVAAALNAHERRSAAQK
jgi:hypothetical protein